MSVRSLADALRAAPDDSLAGLLRSRPELLVPVPSDLSQLAYRAASAPAVARALDRLDRWTLQVLEAACVPAAPTRDDLYRLLEPVPPARVDTAVDRLLEQALLWDDGENLNPTSGVREVIGEQPAGLGPPLRVALDVLTAERARGLLTDLGLADAAPDVPGPADVLVSALAEDARLADLLARAPAEARELLDILTWGPPAGTVDRADRAVRTDNAASAVDWLLAHGLLVAAGTRTVVLPREIALHLRGGRAFADPQPDPPALADGGTARVEAAHVDRTAGGQAFAVTRQVEDLLDGWALDAPPVLKAGGLGVRDLRRAAAALDVEEWQAALLIESAYAAGLVASSGPGDSEWLPTPAYDSWRAAPTQERWATLALAWLGTSRVAALVGSRDDRDKALAALGPDLDRGLAPLARRESLRLIASLPTGSVVAAQSIEAALGWAHPHWPSRLRDLLVGWTLREAEQLAVTGAGALSTPGRALLGAGSPAGRDGPAAHPDAERLDAAADALEPLLPSPVDHVLLQADLTAIAPGPLVSDLGHALALMADVESTGGATVYRFSAGSVRRALDAGRTADELHTLLATHSRTPVPQPLSYLVDDVARRHGRIRVGAAAAYVRCDDTAALDELVALGGRQTADLRLRRLAPTVVSSQTPPDLLLDRLRELGYAPAAESADGLVIVRRPDSRRTAPRSRPPRVAAETVPPGPALVAAAVRAMRAGDRASRTPRGEVVRGMAAGIDRGNGSAGMLPRTAAASTLAMLRAALDDGRPVWIGYVDTHGGVTERVVDPVRLAGGFLTAYDHRSEEVHSFAVHRITGVAALDEA